MEERPTAAVRLHNLFYWLQTIGCVSFPRNGFLTISYVPQGGEIAFYHVG
jgi:hypothetical protein